MHSRTPPHHVVVVGDGIAETEASTFSKNSEVLAFSDPPLEPDTNYTLYVLVASALHEDGIQFTEEDKDFVVSPTRTLVVQTAPLMDGQSSSAAIGIGITVVLILLILLSLWWKFLRHRLTFCQKVGRPPFGLGSMPSLSTLASMDTQMFNLKYL